MNENRAERLNNGKLQWGLVDFSSLEEMVRVLEFGAKKYSPDNWKKGSPTVELCESLLRHVFAFISGENNDPESKLSHLGHIMCNVMFLSYMMKNKPEFDNRCRKSNVISSSIRLTPVSFGFGDSLPLENDNFPLEKYDLVGYLLDNKSKNDNTIDLNVYSKGLEDMYDYIVEKLSGMTIESFEEWQAIKHQNKKI